MEAKDLSCWKCGASLDDIPLPIGRLSECLSCRAELHVCLLCEFYDPSVAESCREPMTEEVKDKTRSNFCEYFYPRPGAHSGSVGGPPAPAAELEALFGGGMSSGTSDEDSENVGKDDPADEARRGLDELFGKSGSD